MNNININRIEGQIDLRILEKIMNYVEKLHKINKENKEQIRELHERIEFLEKYKKIGM